MSYGNKYRPHLIVMKYIFALVVLYSCWQPEARKKSPVNTHINTVSFTCNYDSCKVRCQELYRNCRLHKIPYTKWINYVQDSLLPCWYGTQWSFNGTTETPNKGSIACGYFVTTVIRDAGIRVQRIKMAQCASEEMIQQVCNKTSIGHYSNYSIDKFYTAIKDKPEGLYVVGLDNHTGFITIEKDGIFFTHSSYVTPGYVIKENVRESKVLAASKYKVLGRVKL